MTVSKLILLLGHLSRRPLVYSALAAALVAVSAVSLAQYARYPGMSDLTGQFNIGRRWYDAPGQALDTHFRVYLTDEAARTLFDHMKVAEQPNLCYGPGWREKRIGEMRCTTNDEIHECFFAINIAYQTINGGWTC